MRTGRRGGERGAVGRQLRRGGSRSVAALLAVLFATLLFAAPLPLLGTPSLLPTAGAAAPAGTDPNYPYLGYLRTTITGITPTVVTSSTGPSITVTGTMTNTSKGTLYDLRYVWQRSNALAGVTAIKAEIARPSGAGAVVGKESRILGPTAPPAAGSSTTTVKQTDLAPGASAAFLATIAVGANGLEISSKGVYALTVKVTGDIGQNGQTQYERVGEVHLLGTVLSVPLPALPAGTTAVPATGDRTAAGPAGSSAAAANPVPTAVLWPVVDTPHLGVGEVFLDDSLATTLAPGGRLFGVLSALDGLTSGSAAPTLVVDPQLLDEVEIMAGGYRVVQTPDAPQPALTPTSVPTSAGATSNSSAGGPANSSSAGALPVSGPGTTSTGASGSGTSVSATTPASGVITAGNATTGTGNTRATSPPPADTVAGRGQAAAAAFLTRLRAAARTHRVLVLPYSDPDSVAMMRAGLDDELAALVSKGKTVATRVLQVQPGDPELITDTLVPAGGAVNDATLSFLSAHGISRAVLSPSTVEHAGGPVGTVTIDERADQGGQVRAALTDADLLSRVNDLVARGRSAGLATRLSAVAALLTGGSLDGTGTPLVVSPDKLWTANPTGLSVLGGLLQTLASGRIVSAPGLPALIATARTPARLAYSDAAEAAELPPGYLGRVVAANSAIAAIGQSLVRARTPGAPVPADLLDPLRTALSSVGAAALRSNQGYGGRVLQTVEATIDGVRSKVWIPSSSPSTLAASTAPLLITVRNDLPYSVRVKVVVIDGASVGMTTKDPALEDIPEGGSHQFRIDASVVKAGRFQVHAQIQAADGSIWSAPTTITVSSSAYGALTIVLVAVAGGALTLMVALRLVQRVRNRNRPAGAVPPEQGAAGRPEPDSILAAANESTRPAAGDGVSGNPVGGGASSFPASPTEASPFDEREPPR